MTKHNIWSISIIVLLFGLLCTPLIVAGSLYFPFVTGKVFAFRIIMALALVAWLLLVLRRPEYLPKKSAIIVASGLFIVWLAISNFLGIDPASSFFSNFERMEGWFTHLFLFGYLVVLSSVFRTESLWNRFFGVSLVVGNIVALFATFDSVARTSAVLGNSTYVAIYALFNLYFALLLAYRLFKKRGQEAIIRYSGLAYYAASVLLLGYVIFRTQTRGTVLALVFSAMLFLLLSAVSFWKNKKVRMTAVALLAVAVAGAALFWTNRDAAFIQENPMLVRIATISASEGTGRARVVNWGIALQSIKENPVFGWGQENYMHVFPRFYDPQMYAQEPWFDRTHNAFIDWTVQGGVGALAIYLSLFLIPLYAIHVSTSLTRTEKNLLTSLFVAYGIHNLFVFDNYSSYLMFFTLLGFVVHHQRKDAVALVIDDRLKQVAAAVLILSVLVTSYVVTVKPMIVAAKIIDVLKTQDPDQALNTYDRIFRMNTFGTFEAGTRLLSDISNFGRVDDEQIRRRYMEMATAIGEGMISSNPESTRAHEFYGSFLIQTNNPKRAIEVLERARELAPNRQNNLYTLGYAYINDGQLEKALETFRHAYEVAPENQRAANYYGAMLMVTGDASGREMIKEYSYDDPFFLAVFSGTKQYKEVIKILEKQIADQPANNQLKISLAIAYFRDGQKAKSVTILREVQKAVPEFKAQGDQLIREIQAGRNPFK